MTKLAEPRDNALLLRAVRWLNKIGLPALPGERFEQPFVPGVWIDAGRLVYDPDEAHPGNLLHEAGHLAVLPSRFRAVANGDVDALHAHLDAYMATVTDPDEPVARAIIQSGDCEVIAWSYAASIASRVDPWLAFERGFPSRDEAEEIFQMVRAQCYVGINGLRAAGFLRHIRDFPKLTKWVQP